MNEEVLVIQLDKFRHFLGAYPSSLIVNSTKDQIKDFILDNHEFRKRSTVEDDTRYKQVIPYVMISCNDKLLLLRRLTKQNESRLHNKYSLGIGGHINPLVDNQNDVIFSGLLKELNEEIFLSNISQIDYLGVINDDDTEVGKFHLGLLFHISTDYPDYEILERDKMEGSWININELNDYYPFMESWSQIIVSSWFKRE